MKQQKMTNLTKFQFAKLRLLTKLNACIETNQMRVEESQKIGQFGENVEFVVRTASDNILCRIFAME